MADRLPTTANEFVEDQLRVRLGGLEQVLNSHVLAMRGDLVDTVDDLVRDMVEGRQQRQGPHDRLSVILTTSGGYIGPVQRIVDVFRHFYRHVGFIVPNYAFSAGTILVMSGDDISMDYYSRLGPIDPQVPSKNERLVSALGYLKKWDQLLDKAKDGTITLVEIQLMIEGFDQAELYTFEEAKKLSIALLEEWLVKYKFKDWVETETRKIPVTDQMRRNRATEIGSALSDTERWHSHGYGISMAVLQRDLKLKIVDLDQAPDLCRQIRDYSELLADYMQRRQQQGVIHTTGRYLGW